MWSPGYFVSSVGVDEKTIKKYVEYQGRRIQVSTERCCDKSLITKAISWRSLRAPGLPGGIYLGKIFSQNGSETYVVNLV